MKDLSQFKTVQDVLKQVVVDADANNGTNNLTLLAHFWEEEYVYDEKRMGVQAELVKATFASDHETVIKKQKELATLPKPKVVMVWRLLEPIRVLNGTKTLSDGDKIYRLKMENVTTLYIPEDAVHCGLLMYEETEETLEDKQGRPAKVLKIKLEKGIIDVAAPIVDRNEKIIRPKRAYVTPVSYRTMQITSEMLNKDRLQKRRRYGFDIQ